MWPFGGDASNLVPDDTNGTHDVFVASTNFAAEVSIAENTTAVTTVTATDPDAGQTLSYSITGGADAGKFTIGSSTGALSFVTAPNFELPTDVGGNNVYDVTVQVSDGHGGIDTQAIAVSVQNVVGVTINGTAGNDVIDMTHTVAGQPFPTNEEDILNGGAGSDTLAGGPGADKFVFDLTALTPAQPGSAVSWITFLITIWPKAIASISRHYYRRAAANLSVILSGYWTLRMERRLSCKLTRMARPTAHTGRPSLSSTVFMLATA